MPHLAAQKIAEQLLSKQVAFKDHEGDVLTPQWKVLDEAREVTEPVTVTIRVDHYSISL
jgi:hypothetical protein